MKRADIKRYQDELKNRLPRSKTTRVALTEEFQKALDLLIEEKEDAGYSDLVEAFGTPEEMARTLMQSPLGRTCLEKESLQSGRRKKMICIVSVLAVILMSVGVRTFWSHAEQGELAAAPYGGGDNGYYIIDSPLTNGGLEWEQPWNHTQYRLEIMNTDREEVKVTVRYSRIQEPHVVTVPGGEHRYFDVNHACFRLHEIAMSTLDGDIEGTIKVFVVQ